MQQNSVSPSHSAKPGNPARNIWLFQLVRGCWLHSFRMCFFSVVHEVPIATGVIAAIVQNTARWCNQT